MKHTLIHSFRSRNRILFTESSRQHDSVAMILFLIALLLMPLAVLDAAEIPGQPVVFWSAEPVLPGETAMLQGAGFSRDAKVELSPLGSTETATSAPVLDANERSLRFVVPKDWAAGAYRCRVETKSSAVERLINAPQPWWIQADDGRQATPGGWVRVCGRCLALDPAKAVVELRRDGESWALPLYKTSMWSLDAGVPKDLSPGDYELWTHNGTGGDAGWVHVDRLKIAPANKPWLERACDVIEMGTALDRRFFRIRMSTQKRAELITMVTTAHGKRRHRAP